MNYNCQYDRIASAYNRVCESENAKEGEGLMYKDRFIPSSEMEVGSAEWLVFGALKFNNGNRSLAIRKVKEHADFMDDVAAPEQKKAYAVALEMLRGGASAVTDHVEVRAKSNPLGQAVSGREWGAAKRMYGSTSIPSAIGYVLPDGYCLDFSGNGGAVRGMDHRNICSAIQRGPRRNTSYGAFVDVVLSGAIRYMHPRKFMLGKAPTQRQYSVMYDLLDRTDDYDGPITVEMCVDGDFDDTISVEYRPKTSMSRIRSDIDGFFRRGVVPEGNYDGFLGESMEGVNSYEANNMLDRHRITEFCRGLEPTTGGELEVVEVLLRRLLSSSVCDSFEFFGGRTDGFNGHGNSDVRFRIFLTAPGCDKLPYEVEGRIERDINRNLKEFFGRMSFTSHFFNRGGREYEVILNVSEPKMVKEILKLRNAQMELPL